MNKFSVIILYTYYYTNEFKYLLHKWFYLAKTFLYTYHRNEIILLDE